MVTIKEIARELRIAPSTVSRALNEKKGVSKTLKGKINEQVFYLRSRGYDYTDAIKLCIGNSSSQNLFYIEYHEGYQR